MIRIKWVEIRPKKKLEPDIFRLRLLTECRKIVAEVKNDLLLPTSTWSHKPDTKTEVKFSGSLITFEAIVTDEIYSILDRGDPQSRFIAPVSRPAVTYPGVFSSKTIPGTLTSRPGLRTGSKSRKWTVRGPIIPRRFEETVTKMWQDKMPKRLQEALDDAARKSGYEI